MKIKLFAYPDATEKRMRFLAAPTINAARKIQKESRVPTREELEAAVADLTYVPLLDRKGKATVTRPASSGDFLDAARVLP